EAFYLSSSSEIQRVSVAAARVMLPNGTAPASPPIPASVNKSNDTNGPPGDAHNEPQFQK
ncbi:Protein lethal(2) giant larvaelike, partial [Caligus rogercresseyi]